MMQTTVDFLATVRYWWQRYPLQFLPSTQMGFTAEAVETVHYQADTRSIALVSHLFDFVGALGVLPLHDTQSIVAQLQDKQPELYNLLQIFYHRLLEIFYSTSTDLVLLLRARTDDTRRSIPLFDNKPRLESLLLQSLGDTQTNYQNLLFHYAFYQSPIVSAARLRALLTASTGWDIRIVENAPRRQPLPQALQSHLGDPLNTVLGQTWVVGGHVRLDQHHVCIVVRAPDYDTYATAMNETMFAAHLHELIRRYLGPTYTYALRCEFAGKVRGWCLSGQRQLGITSYVG